MIKKIFLFMIYGFLTINPAYGGVEPLQDQRLKKVYDAFPGQLLWVKKGSLSSCAQTLLETLSHVEQEGLWQENYTPLIEAIKKANLNAPEGAKQADALLTLAALNYISDMRGERLNPQDVAKTIYLKQQAIDEADELKGYLSLPDQCGWIHALAPTTPEYQHLKALLATYRQKKAQGGWPQLPEGTLLEKGEEGPLVETLRAQLMAQDALSSQGQGSQIFDEGLEKSLKAYQDLHGLEPDGKVGPETLKALNTPLEERIRSIIVGLERHRWYPNLPARYIQVNIPGFYLKAVEGGETAFVMPIITGKEYTKTPVFNTEMNEIIFNPTWHVPSSIARELLPKIESNPGAYAHKGYYVDASGKITQSPGPANALGKIRFTLESPFSIYLHGTPNGNLFQKAKRSLSHGCIRVQDPAKLAEFVFHDPEEWPLDRIKTAASGTKTDRVKLDQPLSVYILYRTVFEDENHQMHFVNDIYGQDKAVWSALEKLRGQEIEREGVALGD
jgi:murein L,D-transpeptidase YcbB/YkuD